jgi:hypothetical protein
VKASELPGEGTGADYRVQIEQLTSRTLRSQ